MFKSTKITGTDDSQHNRKAVIGVISGVVVIAAVCSVLFITASCAPDVLTSGDGISDTDTGNTSAVAVTTDTADNNSTDIINDDNELPAPSPEAADENNTADTSDTINNTTEAVIGTDVVPDSDIQINKAGSIGQDVPDGYVSISAEGVPTGDLDSVDISDAAQAASPGDVNYTATSVVTQDVLDSIDMSNTASNTYANIINSEPIYGCKYNDLQGMKAFNQTQIDAVHDTYGITVNEDYLTFLINNTMDAINNALLYYANNTPYTKCIQGVMLQQSTHNSIMPDFETFGIGMDQWSFVLAYNIYNHIDASAFDLTHSYRGIYGSLMDMNLYRTNNGCKVFSLYCVSPDLNITCEDGSILAMDVDIVLDGSYYMAEFSISTGPFPMPILIDITGGY